MAITPEQVRAEVREQIRNKIISKHPQISVVEEGVGSKIAKTLGTLIGANIGGGLGYTTGMIAGTAAAIAVSPLLTAGAIAALPVAAAASLGVVGLLGGGSVGLDLARRVSEKDSEKLVRELVGMIKKRDDMITAMGTTDEKGREKLQAKIAANTDAQVALSKKLMKELTWELKKGLITPAAYEYAEKILKRAEEGRLTYISK
jgi:hypothetical protein